MHHRKGGRASHRDRQQRAGIDHGFTDGKDGQFFGMSRDFRFKERFRIQFRWESFNFLNTPQFSAPIRLLGSADFGRITATLLNNREMQFGLKYIF